MNHNITLPYPSYYPTGKTRPASSRPHGKMPYKQPSKRGGAPSQPIAWTNPNNPVRNTTGLQPATVQSAMPPPQPSLNVIPSTVLMAEGNWGHFDGTVKCFSQMGRHIRNTVITK